MYLTDVFFQNHSPENPEHPAQHTSLLNQIINQWRYNGQIIGREIPLFYAEQENEHGMGIALSKPVFCLKTITLRWNALYKMPKSAVCFLTVFKL